MAKVKFELDAWSEAELDIISDKAVAGNLCESLFQGGNKADSEVAYAIVRLLDSALASMESGRVR